MILAAQILVALLVLAAGYLIPMKVLPWLLVHAGRRLGFRMRASPLTAKRIVRFKSIRRGYVSFVVLVTLFFASFFLELVVNRHPLFIRYGDQWQMPAVVDLVEAWLPFVHHSDIATAERYGVPGKAEVHYREYAEWTRDPGVLERLAEKVERAAPQHPTTDGDEAEAAQAHADAAHYRAIRKGLLAHHAFILMPLYPASPDEQLLGLAQNPPIEPFQGTFPFLGTDAQADDVLAQVIYGFRISLGFALVVVFLGYLVGVSIGAIMGFYGGWTDILAQRGIEVWASIPFLYVLMIVSNIMQPSFWGLCALLLVLNAWINITFTMRGEFYREKARDYVQAARAIGVKTPKIMLRHILPNALVPIVTYLPFEMVGAIFVLVSLDYLHFGLPPSSPSWGRLLFQGASHVTSHPFLVYVPVIALACTLFSVVLIGESVREAFDPKKYARLR